MASSNQGPYLTTNQIFYKEHKPGSAAKLMPKIAQADEIVATGHHWSQLQVNGRQMKSKIFPSSTYRIEEYRDFVKRLHDCKKELYKLFFRCPCVRYDMIDRMLLDLEKTVYMIDYSPNIYVPLKQSHCGGAKEKLDVPYQETTYRTYYNRIKELERYRDILASHLINQDSSSAFSVRHINKIYLTGRSTYYDTLCIPANYMLQKRPTPPGPIDQYTDRRI